MGNIIISIALCIHRHTQRNYRRHKDMCNGRYRTRADSALMALTALEIMLV